MTARGPKSDKIWAAAVRRAVSRRLENEEGKPQKIERLADKVVEMALGGDMSAVQEIANRLDGKPAQSIQHSNDPDNPLIRDAHELTDAELAAIIAGAGSAGTAEAEESTGRLN